MRIEVLVFAQLRDVFGEDRFFYEVDKGLTVGEAVASLIEARTDGKIASLPLSYAVNETFVDKTQALKDGDRLALLPPVSGG